MNTKLHVFFGADTAGLWPHAKARTSGTHVEFLSGILCGVNASLFSIFR